MVAIGGWLATCTGSGRSEASQQAGAARLRAGGMCTPLQIHTYAHVGILIRHWLERAAKVRIPHGAGVLAGPKQRRLWHFRAVLARECFFFNLVTLVTLVYIGPTMIGQKT